MHVHGQIRERGAMLSQSDEVSYAHGLLLPLSLQLKGDLMFM